MDRNTKLQKKEVFCTAIICQHTAPFSFQMSEIVAVTIVVFSQLLQNYILGHAEINEYKIKAIQKLHSL